MPRLNIEDGILADPRFQMLVRRLDGDLERALGRVVRLWWSAQKHWGNGRRPIPLDEFHFGGFDHIVDSGMAEVKEDGVYVRGARDQFEWLAARSDAARLAGQASAEARRAKNGSAIPTGARNRTTTERRPNDRSVATERPPNDDRTSPNPHTLSLSLTHEDSHAVSSPSAPTPRQLADVWNDEAKGAMVKVAEVKAGTKRFNSAKARLQDEPDLDLWRTRIRKLAGLPWVRGETPGRNGNKPWRGNFDWLIRPDTRTKIIEGAYDDDHVNGSGRRTPIVDRSNPYGE